eukprot:TRINITY_DN8513_c0_g1_i2.p2 TRINITY_DN8513_c0_g1~~TRINITY_DN8513_c0_g1_i2.p2  ORF type:complete len:552 (+),score=162.39 TRINITY_DN8513_c0_g1_i2:84-1658(+)
MPPAATEAAEAAGAGAAARASGEPPAAGAAAAEAGRKRPPGRLRVAPQPQQAGEVRLLAKGEAAQLARQHRDPEDADTVPAEIDAERDAVIFAGSSAAECYEAHPDKRPLCGSSPPPAPGAASAAVRGPGTPASILSSESREAASFRPHFADLRRGELLGRGRFGDVYRVEHTPSGRLYALKVIPCTERGSRARDVVRAELERLKHHSQHTVATLQAYYSRTKGTMSLLMELMDFGSLEGCFRELQGSRLSVCEHDIAAIAQQILSALGELRGLHLLHRDVKPDNILIGWRGVVKLGDFGISRFTDNDSAALSGSGSYKWMAPERITGQVYCYNSDVYSLGLVAAYLALGRYPLPVESAADLVFVVDSVDTIDLSGFRGSDDLRNFLLVATLKDRAQRPDARQLLQHPFVSSPPPAPADLCGDRLAFLRHLSAYAAVCRRRAHQGASPQSAPAAPRAPAAACAAPAASGKTAEPPPAPPELLRAAPPLPSLEPVLQTLAPQQPAELGNGESPGLPSPPPPRPPV